MLAFALLSHGNRSYQSSYIPPADESLDMTSSSLIVESGRLPQKMVNWLGLSRFRIHRDEEQILESRRREKDSSDLCW